MSEPIRVAQVLNKMDSGGIEAVVMNYYRNMNREKVQFDFYFAENSAFPQKQELESMGAGIYPIPSYAKVFSYHKVLFKAFKEKEYSVVHAHLSTMSVFALFAAWRAKIPVRICHNHSTAEKGEGKKTILKYLLRPLNRIFATEYFACGKKAAIWMYGKKRVESGKVQVLPNAIETQRYAFDKETRMQLREELGIPQDAIVIGHVGRFMYQKNHRRLIEIYEEVSNGREDVYLLLIGEGELYQEIFEKAKNISNRILFTGSRQDVNKLYSVMDVFCLPSFYEGMPVVAWEAQANGLCCVFSENVSREAAIMKDGEFLGLATGNAAWCEALERAMEVTKRQRVNGKQCPVPDIAEWAEKLENKYLLWEKEYRRREK